MFVFKVESVDSDKAKVTVKGDSDEMFRALGTALTEIAEENPGLRLDILAFAAFVATKVMKLDNKEDN